MARGQSVTVSSAREAGGAIPVYLWDGHVQGKVTVK